MMSRLLRSLVCVTLFTASACTSQLYVKSVPLKRAPPQQSTEILAALRVPSAMLGSLWSAVTVPPLKTERKSPVARWAVEMRVDPAQEAQVAQGEVCWIFPAVGRGHVELMGREVQRGLQGQVKVCAKPAITPSGQLLWRAVRATSSIQRGQLALTTGVLLKVTSRWLDGPASAKLVAQISEARRPLEPMLRAALSRVQQPIRLTKASCWSWRATRAVVSQPVVEPAGLRMPTQVTVSPTRSQRCETKTPMGVDYTLSLKQRPAQLPLQLRIEPRALFAPIERSLGAAKINKGRVSLAGWRHRLIAPDTVEMTADASGTFRGTCLGFPCERSVRGRVGLIGTLQTRAGHLQLTAVRSLTQGPAALRSITDELPTSALANHWRAAWRTESVAAMKRVRERVKALAQRLRTVGRVTLLSPCKTTFHAQARAEDAVSVEVSCPAWVVVDARAPRSESPNTTP